MKDNFEAYYTQILELISKLNSDLKPQFGTMDVLEMVEHHYQMVIDTLPLRHTGKRLMCKFNENKDTKRKRIMYTYQQYSESFC